MKEKLESFGDAIDRLSEALASDPTDLNRDATIQRFEFTYELSWKVLKKYLANKGIKALNPLDCFKAAYQQGLIREQSEQLWINMIKDRNLTSHIYDAGTALDIYGRIKNVYFKEFELLRDELNKGLAAN